MNSDELQLGFYQPVGEHYGRITIPTTINLNVNANMIYATRFSEKVRGDFGRGDVSSGSD
jgi:hypothetical protein